MEHMKGSFPDSSKLPLMENMRSSVVCSVGSAQSRLNYESSAYVFRLESWSVRYLATEDHELCGNIPAR